MKIRLSYMMVAVLCAGLTSCVMVPFQDESRGYLSVNMANDLSEEFVVKSGADDTVFGLEVTDLAGNTVADIADHRDITESNPLELSVGSYRVVAMGGDNINAAFDNPYYEGMAEVKISPNRVTTADITCALANTIFSVEFPETFDQHFDVYRVSVTNGIGDKLVLTNNPDSNDPLQAGVDKRAYFAVTGTLVWELYIQNKDHVPGNPGGIYTVSKTFSEVTAKQHYHLAFSLAESEAADGGLIVNVTLDKSMAEEEHDFMLNFGDPEKEPTFTTNPEFNVTSGQLTTIQIGTTDPKVVTAAIPDGVKSFKTIHTSQILTALGLPTSVEYSGASSTLLNSLKNIGLDMTMSSYSASIDITDLVASLPLGNYEIYFVATDSNDCSGMFELKFNIISDIDAQAVAAKTGWAAFVQLEGKYFAPVPPVGLTFQYRTSSTAEWTTVPESDIEINASEQTYKAIVAGLIPNTQYVFRSYTDNNKESGELSFSTAKAETVHNLSFDNWYQNGNAWMPNLNSSNYVWDSANPGTAGMGVVPTTPEETDVKVKGGKAARLETTTAMGMLAAGNIYVGQFAKVSGLGAELDWGYGFTSRPLALKGFYKYAPKAIDMVKDPYKELKGQSDQCQIQILLTDWADRFHINTSKKLFVDFDKDPNIIAHGSLTSSNTDSDYVEFTIPLVYRNNRTPKYIVIVAAASRYGDYFTGGKGSVLKIDEFSLVYDPSQLTDEQFSTVFSKMNPF